MTPVIVGAAALAASAGVAIYRGVRGRPRWRGRSGAGEPWTLTARLYPGARWRGTVSSAASGQTVDMTPVGLEEKLVVTGALRLPTS